MDTFSDLLSVVKNEVLAETTGDTVSDAELLRVLHNASVQIASLLGFPVRSATVPLAVGATGFSLPVGAVAVRVNQVFVGEAELRAAPLAEVVRRSSFTGSLPTVYHYDPRVVDGEVRFAPALTVAGTAVVLFTQRLAGFSAATIATRMPWDGAFPMWRWVIPLLAGDLLWRMLGDLERADYFFAGRFRPAFLAFAQHLGIPGEPLLGELGLRGDTAVEPVRVERVLPPARGGE